MSSSILDQPHIQRVLFYPRREDGFAPSTPGARRVAVQVEPGVCIGGRLYPASPDAPLILVFHGNGEIAADYHDIAPAYTRLGISLLVMDYRGYGTSDGTPTASHLLSDGVTAFKAVGRICGENDLSPQQLYVMGRSLGSAAAIEVATSAGGRLAGLIIESGFADTFGLLARMGAFVPGANEERDGAGNATKISRVTTRTLIIHGHADVLIPAADARELYRRSAASDKRLVLIPGAGHNDLMWTGMTQYIEAIRTFVFGAAQGG
jgi:alpha-beta hydrolase superfamily lysophospholipase